MSRKRSLVKELLADFPDTPENEVQRICENSGWSAEVARKKLATGEGPVHPEVPNQAETAAMLRDIKSGEDKGKPYKEWGHPQYSFYKWAEKEVNGRFERSQFVYNSTKSKVAASTAQGPPDGSTWIWFIVADLSVSENGTAVLKGDKFQAGWLRNSSEAADASTIKQRKAEMIDSVLKGRQNEYGLQRSGVPVGFKHKWNYSDSSWGSTTTTGVIWEEEKLEDRWKICVTFPEFAEPGGCPRSWVVVAEQRAEKLNKNQYLTNMKGTQYPLEENTASQKDLRASILKEHQSRCYRPPVSASPLGAWLVKKPKNAK
eukprot:TRINITY_DN1911_c1_g1_i1.p1 TRINITY_DN1911_c1_g1~~TRINITY_DN1911_c1_g1_i1.p1  ORF type:complete len:316 (+),score=44.03 TRINITY_DN1911_c1_g1_i1:100-1047(+)